VVSRFTPDFYSVRSHFSSSTSAGRVSPRAGAACSTVDRASIDSYARSIWQNRRYFRYSCKRSHTASASAANRSLCFSHRNYPSRGSSELYRQGGEGHIALSPYVLARISLSFLFAIRRCGKKREIAQRSNRTPERASRVLLRSKQTARPRLAIDRFAVALHRDGP